MSWAEDNGYDAYDIPSYVSNEEHWKHGFHYDINDKEYRISDMTDSHLLNTIKYFESSDTTPLVKEATRRGLLSLTSNT